MVKHKKNKRPLGLFLLLFTAVIASLFFIPDITAAGDVPFTFGAHRGSSVLHIENTLEAFKEALHCEKYQFIEFDVQYTKDKKIVVYHDDTLFRLQKKVTAIADVTYAQLNEISEYKIPLYGEVMDLIGNKKKVNIEFKSQGVLEADKQLVDTVIKDCQERGILDDVLFSSIPDEVVSYISSKYPQLKVGQIFLVGLSTYLNFDYFTQQLYDSIGKNGADYIMLHGVNLRNYTSLAKLKPADVSLAFWYFDDRMYIMHDEKELKFW